MTDSPAPKADGFNQGERGGLVRPKPGTRPVRKRGYHRALARGEVWALVEKGHREMLIKMQGYYYQAVVDSFAPIPLSRLLKKESDG